MYISRSSHSGRSSGHDLGVEHQVERLAARVRNLTSELVEFLREDEGEGPSRAAADRMASRLERIIGGAPVDAGGFAECCLIGNASSGGFLQDWFSTGTLIHPRVVITADEYVFRSNGALGPNSIGIGIEDEQDVALENIVRVAQTIKHPTEDVALLILQTNAPVNPVPIASTDEVANADRVHLVGFGNCDPVGSMGFGTKREVNVRMNVVRKHDKEDLSEAEAALGFNSFTEFVAGRKGLGNDSCKGDSGGPAYIYVGNKRKLAGATSRATDEADDACGDGGVYVRADKLTEWIDEVIAQIS